MRKIIAALLLALAAPSQAPGDFVIGHIPDTQWYTNRPTYLHHFNTMTAWQSIWPLDAIAHVGDVSQNALPVEFQRGRDALLPIWQPLVVVPGNHDFDGGRKPHLTEYLAAGFLRNSVHRDHRGRFMLLGLEWDTHDDGIQWAREQMELDPLLPTIIVTHSALNLHTGARGRTGAKLDGAGDNSDEQRWQKLCEVYPQIVAVICGHGHGRLTRTDTTILGREVHQLLFNPQGDPWGGQGFQRAMWFQRGGLLSLWDLSMSFTGLPPDRTGVEFLTWDPVVPMTTRYRTGEDTHIYPYWGGWGNRWGADLLYSSDNQDVALLRFDGIGGVGPISVSDKVVLTITCEGYQASGSGFTMHRMTVPWDATSSWNGLGGVSPGVNCEIAPDATQGPLGKGTLNIDVTASVRAWAAGAPNYGWAFLAAGSDNVGFRSFDFHHSAERPMLTLMR